MSRTPEVDAWLMSYKRYLKSPEWQDIRRRVLDFWDYKCATCSAEHNLHIHHRTYVRVGMENLNDLIVLCERCHGKFHETVGRNQGPSGPQGVREIAALWLGTMGIEK